MKLIFLAAIAITLIGSGCTTPYFLTSNNLYLQPATAYLNDGTTKSGKLTVLFENGVDLKQNITITNPESKQTETINLYSIRYYRIGSDCYVPKMVDLNLNGGYHFLFVKRLTSESSRIQFYELHQVYKSTSTGEDRKLYYISLPTFSKYEVWSTFSIHLAPDFYVKMSDVVGDCPALANKVRGKMDGYYVGNFLVPDSRRVEVYKRIIAEYDSCH